MPTTLTSTPQHSTCVHSYNLDPNPGAIEMIDNLNNILKMYDSRIRPNGGGEPVVINVSLDIISFHSVSETDMDWSVMVYLQQEWFEPRLRHNASRPLTLAGTNVFDTIWVPDTFFKHAKTTDLHKSPKMNSLIRISQNGKIYYSLRMSITSSCHMDLHTFPFDSQLCKEQVSSYAYTVDDIIVKWSSAGVEVKKDVMLPQYSLSSWKITDGFEKLVSGNYSVITVSFMLKRQLGFYLLQIYIPSSALVIIAWLTLWIDASTSSPARASLGITTILALVTQSSWLRSEIPKVAYVTALDVWLVTCQLVVFLILLQFTFIYFLNKLSGRRAPGGQSSKKQRYEVLDKFGAAESNIDVHPPDPFEEARGVMRRNGNPLQQPKTEETSFRRNTTKKTILYSKIAHQTDKHCRVIFMALFLIFNIVYWTTYTIGWTNATEDNNFDNQD
ncbi:glycine receptor subunit alpha-2-like [Glandiceps talaboti]